jgi:hypothetical protein
MNTDIQKGANVSVLFDKMVEAEVSIADIIDHYIEVNGIIGVGLITMEEQLSAVVNAHHKKRN